MKDRRANEDKVKPLPSQEELNRVLRYEPDTGVLFWRERPRADFSSVRSWKVWNKRYADQPALAHTEKSGYRNGHLFGELYKAHRVIWKMVHGVEPDHIDHIDGVRANNRISNLRNTNRDGNSKNRKLYSSNKSGMQGVYHDNVSGKWKVQVGVGPGKYRGVFDTLEEAQTARLKAEALAGYHANHGRKFPDLGELN